MVEVGRYHVTTKTVEAESDEEWLRSFFTSCNRCRSSCLLPWSLLCLPCDTRQLVPPPVWPAVWLLLLERLSRPCGYWWFDQASWPVFECLTRTCGCYCSVWTGLVTVVVVRTRGCCCSVWPGLVGVYGLLAFTALWHWIPITLISVD